MILQPRRHSGRRFIYYDVEIVNYFCPVAPQKKRLSVRFLANHHFINCSMGNDV
jgi:hypothetical protein